MCHVCACYRTFESNDSQRFHTGRRHQKCPASLQGGERERGGGGGGRERERERERERKNNVIGKVAQGCMHAQDVTEKAGWRDAYCFSFQLIVNLLVLDA